MREDSQINPRLSRILEIERSKRTDKKPGGLPSLLFSVLLLVSLIACLIFFLVADLFLESFRGFEVPVVQFGKLFQNFDVHRTAEIVVEGELYQKLGRGGFGPVAVLSRGELVQVIESARVGDKELLKVTVLSLGLQGWISPNLLSY